MVVASGNPFAKEMVIRKRILNIYNKRQEDFSSLREYNDYLEEVEDMTTNLIDGIDVAAIEAKIAQYKEENAEQITLSQARKAEELAAALQASKGGVVMQSDTTDGAMNQSSQGFTGQGQYVPAVTGVLGQPRPTGVPQPNPLSHDMNGYAVDDEEMMRLRAERGGRAGGWSIQLSRKRALEEAFSSIWV
ncbi:hypothetical protein MKW94_027760 [Papaver nudicaule]|uniref:MAT1 centre domain-containing protein n=1 Tax=Papaver nudicaule TaxID=74823 RepID=A0AA41VI02_PAPNU|nr:hypothetical protein [Papaver nudicaule]MCL7041498.1 hypothetical protein [Papaver nudicaule]